MHPLKGYHRLIDQEEGENKNNRVKRFGLGVAGELCLAVHHLMGFN